jgi:eukaryotic-like serine/threonine-protein kinase
MVPDSRPEPDVPPAPAAAAPVERGAFRVWKTMKQGALLGGRYLVQGFIGQGAMARVYLAEDVETEQPVAVKILEAGPNQSPEMRARFLQEAKLAMAVDHPNVVRIHAFGDSAEGLSYIVMEPLLGESLRAYLRDRGSMPVALAIDLLRQAAAGLAAAHRVGVFHRDVKPDNLFLVGPPGEPHGLKVLDFGLAQLGWRPPSRPDIAVGTIEYMAPEQIVGESADARTDVYGLGCVMFRTLTNQLPFDARDDHELLAHHLVSPAPPPSWLHESLDPRLEAIILTALRKRPENRYASMVDLIADLDRILGVRAGRKTGLGLRHAPDVYAPTSEKARAVAQALYAKLGRVFEG